jgi:Spy/CpxP family protein refolding chaperone
MKRGFWIGVPVAGALVMSGGISAAAGDDRAQHQVVAQAQAPEQIYGSQLMTEQERAEYQAKMRAAKSPEEREQIKKEHHERMKARAEERGVPIPPSHP